MSPHLVCPEFGQHVADVALCRVNPVAGQGQARKFSPGFVMERAVEREEEQLPPGEIAECLDLGAGIGEAPRVGSDRDPGVGLVDPVGQRFGRAERELAAFGVDVDGAIARHDITRPGGVIGHHMTFPEVDGRHVAFGLHPVGRGALGVGAFRLPLDGDGHLAGTVVARRMGLVRPEVRQEDRGIVQPRPPGKARNIESEEGIGQVGEDHGGNGQRNQPLALEAQFDAAGQRGIGQGHPFAPFTRRSR